jgi:hypothetical protein
VEKINYIIFYKGLPDAGMDGEEAFVEIQKSEPSVQSHKIPEIAMTANAMQCNIDICSGVGMNDYISKSADPPTQRKTGKMASWERKRYICPDKKRIGDKNYESRKYSEFFTFWLCLSRNHNR